MDTCVVVWDEGGSNLLNSFLNTGLFSPQHIIYTLTVGNIGNLV